MIKVISIQVEDSDYNILTRNVTIDFSIKNRQIFYNKFMIALKKLKLHYESITDDFPWEKGDIDDDNDLPENKYKNCITMEECDIINSLLPDIVTGNIVSIESILVYDVLEINQII